MLDTQSEAAEVEADPGIKELMLDESRRKKEMFDSILDVSKHNALVARGERRFSHKVSFVGHGLKKYNVLPTTFYLYLGFPRNAHD